MAIRHEATVSIARPPDEVIAFLADLERHPEYWESVHAVTLVAGKAGQPGARYRRVLHAFGRPRDTLVELLEIEPGRRVVYASLTAPLRVRVQIDAVARDGRTEVRLVLEGRPSGHLRLLRPWVRRLLARKTQVSLERARGLLDARNLAM